MSFISSAPVRRLAALLPVAALALLQGCGGTGRAATTPNVTASQQISVTASGTTVLQPGGTVTLTASVVTDPSSQGVTWALTGVGTLSDVTSTKVTYTAPAAGTVSGAVSVLITATGVHDTTQTASGTIRINGSPVLQASTFFPGNVGTAYGAAVSVLGGLAPFTYEVSSSTPLPPGLSLCTTNCKSVGYTTVTGTPTTVGTYPFTIKVTDANSATSTVDLSLTINAATACLVNGQFAHLETGFTGGRMFVAAASYNVVSTGTVSGHQDQGAATVVDESVTGTCTTRTSNNGIITITGSGRSPQYNYALTIGLDKARTQLMNGGDSSSSTGQMLKQDPTAFNAAALAGDWAFGTIGSYAPVGKVTGKRIGVAGRLTVDAAGAVTAGRLDASSSTGATSFIGTMGAPDANGRGTLSITGGASYKFIYYVVNANKLFIVQTDNTGGAPQLAGTMTRQALPYSGASLSSQGILSLWGAYGSDTPHASLALGRLSGATATDLYTGTLQVDMDVADRASATLAKTYKPAPYAVDVLGDGRATFSFTDSASAAHNYVLYLDGQDDGYVVETTGSNGTAGLLEAQMAGPYSYTLPGLFVSGTQYPQDPGPLTLAPHLAISGGSFSDSTGNNYVSGVVALDPVVGRAVGTFSVAGSSSYIIGYVVNGGAVRLLRLGYLLRAPTLEFVGD